MECKKPFLLDGEVPAAVRAMLAAQDEHLAFVRSVEGSVGRYLEQGGRLVAVRFGHGAMPRGWRSYRGHTIYGHPDPRDRQMAAIRERMAALPKLPDREACLQVFGRASIYVRSEGRMAHPGWAALPDGRVVALLPVDDEGRHYPRALPPGRILTDEEYLALRAAPAAPAAPAAGFDFGEAIRLLKAERYVTRRGWNGKGMLLYLLRFRTPLLGPCVVLVTPSGQHQPGWLASQADLLAEDWYECEGPSS